MSRARPLVALLLAALALVATTLLRAPVATAGASRVAKLPVALAGWSSRDVPLIERHYELLETRDVVLRDFAAADGSAAVLACVAVAGPAHKAAHPPEICYRGQGWTIEQQQEWQLALAGRVRPFQELVVAQGGERLLVWSWYRVGDEETESWWREQWLALAARVARDDAPAALLRFSTPLGREGIDAARLRLARFLAQFLPAADAALAPPAGAGESRRGK